jgi:hypothetical protein
MDYAPVRPASSEGFGEVVKEGNQLGFRILLDLTIIADGGHDIRRG